jgi:hypothetical protein
MKNQGESQRQASQLMCYVQDTYDQYPMRGKFPAAHRIKTLWALKLLIHHQDALPTTNSTEQHYNMFESHYMYSGNPCQQSEEPPLDGHG